MLILIPFCLEYKKNINITSQKSGKNLHQAAKLLYENTIGMLILEELLKYQ